MMKKSNILKLQLKKGNFMVASPIILLLSLLFLIFIGIFMIRAAVPFILREKLNTIAQKYMFVIEKYGYLTPNEKEEMLSELKQRGFDIEKITITAPSEILSYGQLITFEIEYVFSLQLPMMRSDQRGQIEKHIPIHIRKYSYVKR